MKNILFTPLYNIGDIVCLKLSRDRKMVIDGYQLKQVTDAGEVSFFRYSLYDEDGIQFQYAEHDLQLIEEAQPK